MKTEEEIQATHQLLEELTKHRLPSSVRKLHLAIESAYKRFVVLYNEMHEQDEHLQFKDDVCQQMKLHPESINALLNQEMKLSKCTTLH